MRLPANAAFRPTPQGTIPPGSRHRPTAGASGAGAEAGVGADADDAPTPGGGTMPNGRNSSPARESRAEAHVFVRFRNKMPIFAVDFP